MYGLMMPPNCPTELISAMPLAAAMPERKRVGRIQKRPSDVMMPVAAIVRPITSITVLPGKKPHST